MFFRKPDTNKSMMWFAEPQQSLRPLKWAIMRISGNFLIGSLQSINLIDGLIASMLYYLLFFPTPPRQLGSVLHPKGQLDIWTSSCDGCAGVGRVRQKYSVCVCVGWWEIEGNVLTHSVKSQLFSPFAPAGWNFLSVLVCILPSCLCPIHKVIKEVSDWVLTLITAAHRLQANSITFRPPTS